MRTYLRFLAALAAFTAFLGSVWWSPDAAAQGVSTTRHNLGTGSAVGNNKFSGTDEVCVFCHTPHAAATGAANPPLWNKSLPTGPYTIYSSTTMDAARATDGLAGSTSIGSVSIACLSCHDGATAMNSVINAPGSGLTNSTYSAGTWTVGTGPTPVRATTDGRLGSGVANLTADLSNDHPIGIQYCGGGINGSTGAGTCADTDFFAPSSAVIAGTRVFWVETGGNTTRNKTDIVLYNRDFGASAAPAGVGPSVECASCHDPHTNVNPTFLRRSNTGSGVCLACHNK